MTKIRFQMYEKAYIKIITKNMKITNPGHDVIISSACKMQSSPFLLHSFRAAGTREAHSIQVIPDRSEGRIWGMYIFANMFRKFVFIVCL